MIAINDESLSVVAVPGRFPWLVLLAGASRGAPMRGVKRLQVVVSMAMGYRGSRYDNREQGQDAALG